MSNTDIVFEFTQKALGSLPESMNPYSYDLTYTKEESNDKRSYYELEAKLTRQTDGEVIAKRTYRYGSVEKAAQQGDFIKIEEERIKFQFILELLLRGALKTEELTMNADNV